MNKELEKEILKMVFIEDHFEKIIDGEKPDFKLIPRDLPIEFGVEVTEIFNSQSEARIKNHNSYRHEIIESRKFLHKDDIEKFDIGEVELSNNKKSNANTFKAIILEATPFLEYINIIVEAIKDKDIKYKKYDKSLDYIDLIIRDRAYQLTSIKAKDFFKKIYTTGMKKCLYRTKFREIFFVTYIEKDRCVYFPLKQILFVATFYVFGKFLDTQKANQKIKSKKRYS